jgi:hypothetical protein
VDVSNDSSINEVDECIIHKSVVNRTGVEDGKVGVLNAWGVEVGVRVSASMQGHPIDRVSLLAASLDSHTVSDRDVVDVLSYFGLPYLLLKRSW